MRDIQTAQIEIYEEYVFKKRSKTDYIEEKEKLQKQEACSRNLTDRLEKRIGTLRKLLSGSGADAYEYLQNCSFTELTREVADRFVKKIVVCDEQNIKVEWNFSVNLPEEIREYQLAFL